MKLNDKKSYYMIISGSHKLQDDYTNKIYTSRLEDTLYRKGYSLISVGNNLNSTSFIAYKEDFDNNNELRYDAIELMDSFYQEDVIVKYFGDSGFKKISKDGSEGTLTITNYNGDLERSYYNEGFSFSFIENQDFYIPKKKDDFKVGMIVEVKNNLNQWIPREVVNLDDEWNKMYNLLIKYGRIRCLRDI